MKKYVLGFMFSLNKSQVLLIEKNHPDWQKGKLNGIGGTIEEGEQENYAMVREFKEETGLNTNIIDWDLFAILQNENKEGLVYCYKAFSNNIWNAKTITDEKIITLDFNMTSLDVHSILENLNYLIPLALTSERNIGIVNFNYAKEK